MRARRHKEDGMSRKSVVVIFLCLWTASALTAAGPSPQKTPGAPGREQTTHLQRGLASFEQGFYEMLPKGRRAEAEDAFVTAVRELELALEAEPNNVRAHRTLARVHSLRKDHAAAAAHYRRLTEIDPFDVDAYVLAAVSLVEAGRFDEARIELERAKGRTADARALALLDSYLAKLAEAERKAGPPEGRGDGR
jgi:tetratricopeptide (TPR) repeat protein